MSALEKIITAIPELNREQDSFSHDKRYMRKFSELSAGALPKNCDIMQLPNGDVVIAEVKTVYYSYAWDTEKGKFVRAKTVKKRKSDDDDAYISDDDHADIIDEAILSAPPVKRGPGRPSLKDVRARELREKRMHETA